MSRALARRLRHAAAIAFGAAIARGDVVAQTPSLVSLRAAHRDTLAIDASASLTAVFALRNRTNAAVEVAPTVRLPQGWSTLFAPSSVALGPLGADTWLAGIALPTGAPAGIYAIHASLGGGSEHDSLLVRIVERRAIDIVTVDAPAFAGGGDVYSLRFTVRNRGNVADTVDVVATSSAGSRIDLRVRSLTLEPGRSADVVARVASRFVGPQSIDDVVEVTVTDRAAKELHASASTNVLIVARGDRVPTMASVPAELTVRGASPGSGVSPVALTGAGPIAAGSNTTMDFAFRLPAGQATVFGERDEYRLDLANDTYTVRLGDGSHAFSPLSSSGSLGFGGEVQRHGARWSTGAYVTKDRWMPSGSTEAALFARREFMDDKTSASAVLVRRNTGAAVAAVEGRARLAPNTTLDVETATSDSAGVAGVAHRAQLVGSTAWMTYDAGWMHATPTFAAATRGNDYKHAAFTLRPEGPVSFGVTANDYSATSFIEAMPADRSRSRSMLFESMTNGGSSLSYERLMQTGAGSGLNVVQHSFRVRGRRQFGRFDLRGGLGHHIVEATTIANASFESFDAALHTTVRQTGSVDLYLERNRGGAIASLIADGVNVGAATSWRLPHGLSLYANGSTMLGAKLTVTSMSQADLTLSKRLRNGMTAALRQHVAIMPNGSRLAGMNGVYLELRAPLAIPTVPLRTPGRVAGRIVDASTGRGLADVLVRVGKQTAISDANGRVALSGLDAGKYSVTVESSDRSRAAVTVGDATVEVSSRAGEPVRFAAALAIGAHVRASVRQFAFTSPSVLAGADSIIDAGPMHNTVVALMGTRDTIYQTTSVDGIIDFGVIAPGSWTAKVMAEDLPAFHAFNRETVSLVIRGGEQRDLEFKLLPRRRSITVLASDDTLLSPSIAMAPRSDSAPPMRERRVAPRARVASHATGHAPRIGRQPQQPVVRLQAEPASPRSVAVVAHDEPRSRSWLWILVTIAFALVVWSASRRRGAPRA